MRETRSDGPNPSPSSVAPPGTVENDLTHWTPPFSLRVPMHTFPDWLTEANVRDAMPDSDALEGNFAGLGYFT